MSEPYLHQRAVIETATAPSVTDNLTLDGSKHVFQDKHDDFWFDPGNRQLLALDEPIAHRLREKWPQRTYEDIEAEFGPLAEVAVIRSSTVEVMLQFRRSNTDVWHNWWAYWRSTGDERRPGDEIIDNTMRTHNRAALSRDQWRVIARSEWVIT